MQPQVGLNVLSQHNALPFEHPQTPPWCEQHPLRLLLFKLFTIALQVQEQTHKNNKTNKNFFILNLIFC